MHLRLRSPDPSLSPLPAERFSHLAFEESGFAVFLLDPQGSLLFANSLFSDLCKLPLSDLQGSSWPSFLQPPSSLATSLPWGFSPRWNLLSPALSCPLPVDLLRLHLFDSPDTSLFALLPTPWPHPIQSRLSSLTFALHDHTHEAFFSALSDTLHQHFAVDRLVIGQSLQGQGRRLRVHSFRPHLPPTSNEISRDTSQPHALFDPAGSPRGPLWWSFSPDAIPAFSLEEIQDSHPQEACLFLLGHPVSSLPSSSFLGFLNLFSSSSLLRPLELSLFLAFSEKRILSEAEALMRDTVSSLQRSRARILLDLFSAYAYEAIFDGETLTTTWLSDNCSSYLGRPTHELLKPSTWEAIIHEDDKTSLHKYNSSLLALGSADIEFRALTKDGQIRWFHMHGRALDLPDAPKKTRIVGAAREITQEKLLLQELQHERRLHRLITEHASDLIALHSIDGAFEYISPSCERLLGYPADQILGQSLFDLFFHPDERNLLWRTREQLERKETVSLLSRFRHRDGRYLWFESTLVPILDSSGITAGIQSISRNVTRRKETEERLHKSIKEIEYLNQHDLLTGLPNHILFQDRLEQAILQARRERLMTAVVCFDLDRFHRVNDLLGHSRASQLLYSLSERLRTTLRPGDSLARMGGNEFMLLLPSILDEQIPVRLAQTLLQSLHEEPFEIDGHEIFLNASIGISLFPSDSDDSETLIRHAYSAMRRAKQEGSGHFRLYAPAMHVAANERLTIESSLRRALERQQLAVYYQPQVCVVNELLIPFNSRNTLHSAPASTHYVIDGMEALLRWKHPDLGLISPARFIPVAEDLGLIVSMGEWIMRQACIQNKAWQDAGMSKVPVSVNLSPWQFRRPNLIQTIESVLSESNLDPQYLELEITENIFMRDEAEISDRMRKIQQMGVKIAIDDFGTGYSSLSYLKRFPIHILKIDQSFIKDVTNNPNDTALTKGIIALAHNLDLRVVAEGVHSYNQLHYLRSLKCDRLQGYLFSPPVAGEDFEKLLRLRTILPRETGN